MAVYASTTPVVSKIQVHRWLGDQPRRRRRSQSEHPIDRYDCRAHLRELEVLCVGIVKAKFGIGTQSERMLGPSNYGDLKILWAAMGLSWRFWSFRPPGMQSRNV